MLKLNEKKQLEIPTPDQLMWPTLKALKDLGGSGSIQELLDKIIEIENYSEEIQQCPHTERQTKLEYNSAWARTSLKQAKIINNSQGGVWVLLDCGEDLTEKDINKAAKDLRKQRTEKMKQKKDKKVSPDEDASSSYESLNKLPWKEQLINKLLKLHPSDFEKLCQLVLRESGFSKVRVTGKTGDGGIDGLGILRVNLLSFHVSFQCKRYKSSVGSGEIRDFRGAMIGRGDKGLFITTGTFTSSAREEANRDGAPAIDLINGEELCRLLKNLKLGVQTRVIEEVTVDESWFDRIAS